MIPSTWFGVTARANSATYALAAIATIELHGWHGWEVSWIKFWTCAVERVEMILINNMI